MWFKDDCVSKSVFQEELYFGSEDYYGDYEDSEDYDGDYEDSEDFGDYEDSNSEDYDGDYDWEM